MSLPAITAYR